MKTLDGQNTQTVLAARRVVPFMAAAGEDISDVAKLPSQIELIKAGVWPASSVKGPLTITVADLHEMVYNFAAGVGLPGDGSIGLPIDFSHNDWLQAAGWIKSLEVVNDTLVANVTWTAEGAEALVGGMYKCISPSFWPACMGEWCDPENPDSTARNVLVGAGLTNIPFFKDLQPLMASNTSEKGGKIKTNVIYINASERKTMQLDEIRVKDAASLTDEEKTFVAEHKAELSAEELTKFELADTAADVTPVVPTEDENQNNEEEEASVADPELAAVNASLKSGEMIAVKASVFNDMEKTVNAMKREKVTASVTAHVERGAIKADQVKQWTDRILSDETMQDLLTSLPTNQVLASEIGKEEQTTDISATKQLGAVAEKIMADKRANSYGAALIMASNENPELAQASNAERKVN